MERVETLREQASVLRSLAKSFDSLSFEGDLIKAADLADEIELNPHRAQVARDYWRANG